ncbi:hypothetical protein [Mumia zhuanghuii]|uniref:Uncharacterized protein n=1 Tax=Mumia zhuanghuii TaxID=2585211 RepID=A0A5C4LVS5_9ACTN|nr:hypothetical protein [Mumia zhuanghuii]TNC22043.1 hypothetical protein FHE65_36220 [Mumia zhuanghuii]TNC22180.1 hypothetical protein FHE65_35875 [Mumia zhuanghuii]
MLRQRRRHGLRLVPFPMPYGREQIAPFGDHSHYRRFFVDSDKGKSSLHHRVKRRLELPKLCRFPC